MEPGEVKGLIEWPPEKDERERCRKPFNAALTATASAATKVAAAASTALAAAAASAAAN